MSDQQHNDGRADAWAAVGVIALIVAAVVYYLAGMP